MKYTDNAKAKTAGVKYFTTYNPDSLSTNMPALFWFQAVLIIKTKLNKIFLAAAESPRPLNCRVV